ncbi:MAG TPA: hypothetical protein VGL55_05680 [Steroidobacteraceae bacterium]|jgi:hypothetical protein
MVSRKSESRSRVVRTQVNEVVLHLRQIQSAIIVAVAALRRQNSDLDEDIANVLQRSAADRIQDQIERLEGVTRSLASLGRGARPMA